MLLTNVVLLLMPFIIVRRGFPSDYCCDVILKDGHRWGGPTLHSSSLV